MRGEMFINICQAALHGSPRYVRHLRNMQAGKIVYCAGDRIEVDLGDRRETWSGEECEELESGEIVRPC